MEQPQQDVVESTTVSDEALKATFRGIPSRTDPGARSAFSAEARRETHEQQGEVRRSSTCSHGISFHRIVSGSLARQELSSAPWFGRRRSKYDGFFWWLWEQEQQCKSIQGDFIYRHHVELRVQLHVPKEETFPIPLKYIDVTTFSNLDVLQDKRIDDYWNVDVNANRSLSDSQTDSRSSH